MIKEVDTSNWDALVADATRPAFVEFWAEWCGPCKFMAPEVESLSEKYGESIDFFKVNVDENPIITTQFSVMSIPAVLFFEESQTPKVVIGYRKADVIEDMLGLAQAVA